MSDQESLVYIVDDDASLRRSIQYLVTSIGLPSEVYSTAREFLDAYDPSRPACLVLDLRMPDMNGLELQDELVARGHEIPIIMITGYSEVPAAVRALRAGAMDFIEKPFSDQALLGRIQEALTKALEKHRAHAAHQEWTARLQCLTPREATVMQCVVDGLANKQIAARLKLSEKTVEAHRARVMKKLGARNAADLVRLAVNPSPSGNSPVPPSPSA